LYYVSEYWLIKDNILEITTVECKYRTKPRPLVVATHKCPQQMTLNLNVFENKSERRNFEVGIKVIIDLRR
jgi:hypothetical protein